MDRTFRSLAPPLPASGPKLLAALDQALSHLENRAGAFKISHPEHLTLWKEILLQSKEHSSNFVAPNLLKGDIAARIAIRLTGRQWASFEKWFEQKIAPELRSLATQSRIPAIRPVRLSDRKGGYPEQSEAILYVAYFEKSYLPDVGAKIDDHPLAKNAPKTSAAPEEFTNCQEVNLQLTTAITSGSSEKPSDLGHRPSEMHQAELEEAENSDIHELSPSNNHMPHPKNEAKINSRWRFGLSMLLMGTFLAVVAEKMIPESHRSMFIGFSVVLAIMGLWDMDRANKGFSR